MRTRALLAGRPYGAFAGAHRADRHPDRTLGTVMVDGAFPYDRSLGGDLVDGGVVGVQSPSVRRQHFQCAEAMSLPAVDQL